MSVRIGLGASGIAFADAAAFWRWVDFCEDSPLDSIWISDRLVSTTPALESMTTVAALAGRTRRIKFGMNAVVLPSRDPLVLAKEAATIDYLSGGRLLPVYGVGGDTAPEWRATGRGTQARGRQSDEMLQIMTRLWQQDRVSFQGKHYTYEDVSISPKPVQQPLPVWIGGSSPAAVKRTALYGTGWLGGAIQSPKQVETVVTSIKAALAETGRTIDDDHYGASFMFRFGSWDEPIVQRQVETLQLRFPGSDPRVALAVGGAQAVIDLATAFRAAGVSKFVLRPIAGDEPDVLEQCRRLVNEALPVVHAMS
jgi:probable F420-dependent oxidoreductase